MRLNHLTIVQSGEHGSPIIFVPGLSTQRSVWDSIVPTLARSHRVFLVQVNGFANDDPGGNLTAGLLEGLVADLHAFLSGEGLEQAIIIGHSFGGLVALKLALTHPNDAGALMIVDSLPFVGVMLSKEATAEKIEPIANDMRGSMQSRYGEPPDEDWILRVAEHNALLPNSRFRIAEWAREADPRVAGQMLYEGLTTDLREYLSSINIPVIVLYAWSAETLSRQRADELYQDAYQALPRISYAAISNSGHFIMLDQPTVFAIEVCQFINSWSK